MRTPLRRTARPTLVAVQLDPSWARLVGPVLIGIGRHSMPIRDPALREGIAVLGDTILRALGEQRRRR